MKIYGNLSNGIAIEVIEKKSYSVANILDISNDTTLVSSQSSLPSNKLNSISLFYFIFIFILFYFYFIRFNSDTYTGMQYRHKNSHVGNSFEDLWPPALDQAPAMDFSTRPMLQKLLLAPFNKYPRGSD